MSEIDADLIGEILDQHFGSTVNAVGKALARCGPGPLSMIAAKSKQRLLDVKKSLRVLMHHNIVTARLHSRGFLEYSLCQERVMCIIRYPQYIYVAKLLYDDFGEELVDAMLKEGQIQLSTLLARVYEQLQLVPHYESIPDIPKKLYEVFESLAGTHFVERSIDVSKTTAEEVIAHAEEVQSEDLFKYNVPHVNFAAFSSSIVKTEVKSEHDRDTDSGEPSAKKQRVESSPNKSQSDEGIYWRVNCTRFHLYMRDLLISSAAKTHYADEKLGLIVKTILRLSERFNNWDETTRPISKQEIASRAIKDEICANAKEVEELLSIFDSDIGGPYVALAERAASGGMYSVNTFKALTVLVESCITSIVEHRFGAKCARIFRILLLKKQLQQKHIEEIAMLPAKECRELAFTLVREGYARTMHVPKHADYAPSKTFFIFGIDMDKVVRLSMDRCKRAIYNGIVRREHDYNQNRSLIERKNFIDTAIDVLKTQENTEQQVDDLNGAFSTHENDLISSSKRAYTSFEQVELQVDETLYLLQMWLEMKGMIEDRKPLTKEK